MKQVNLNTQDNIELHPSDTEWFDYLGGRLAEAAHEEVQAHLVDCDRCLELFRDMREFFDSHRAGESMITEDVEKQWVAVWNRIEKESQTSGQNEAPLILPVRSRFNSVSILALAAVLVVVFALGFWALSQRRQKQQLGSELESAEKRAAELQAAQEELTERLRKSEQERLELQEETRRAASSAGSDRSATGKPEVNVPIYDLYARNANERSGNASDLNLIRVPATARTIVLILNGDGLPLAPSYGIEIINKSGRTMWRGGDLKKGHLGNLTLTIDRSLLPNGTYRIKLSGRNSEIGEYVLKIE